MAKARRIVSSKTSMSSSGKSSWLVPPASTNEKSAVLLAPLAKDAGGWESCPGVFGSKDDPGYKILLTALKNWQAEWQKSHAFGSPTFQVNRQYIREMVRFGILPEGTCAEDVNPYKIDRRYWEMFNYKPARAAFRLPGQTGLTQIKMN
jgi:hypothetical protein